MADAPLVEVDDLTFRYRRATEPALRSVSLRIEPGEVLLIAGPSGCGKSTLIRALNGLIHRAVGNDNAQGPAIVDYLKSELNSKRVAVLDDKSEYGKGIADIVLLKDQFSRLPRAVAVEPLHGAMQPLGFHDHRCFHRMRQPQMVSSAPAVSTPVPATGSRAAGEPMVLPASFDEEATLILSILNDAWSDNWGFIPLTEAEIAYAGKKLKPIVLEDMIKIAEYDGEPVAFMMALPDINQFIRDLDGSLFPFGWAKLLWRLRKPRTRRARVPLMGVAKSLHGTRLASQSEETGSPPSM